MVAILEIKGEIMQFIKGLILYYKFKFHKILIVGNAKKMFYNKNAYNSFKLGFERIIKIKGRSI